MIVTIGTNDTLASPGAQLDYYQSVLDTDGPRDRRSLRALLRHAADRARVERDELRRRAARGRRSRRRRFRIATIISGLLFDWVENGTAPGMSVTVTAGERSLPLCSYPTYPRYRKGEPTSASAVRMRGGRVQMKPGSSSSSP